MKVRRLIVLGSDSDMLFQCSMRIVLAVNVIVTICYCYCMLLLLYVIVTICYCYCMLLLLYVIVTICSDKIRYCLFASLLGCL